MDIISTIGSIIAVIIAFLLVNKKGKNISDKILIAWVLNFALHFAMPILIERQILLHPSYWAALMGIFLLAHPPFLFVYTNSLARKVFKAKLATLSNFGYITVGQEPDYFDPLEAFSSTQRQKTTGTVDFEYVKMLPEDQTSVPYISLFNGIRLIFADPAAST
jgi:hypothetical protein